MTEFTLLIRGRDLSTSPEQMQKTMDKWVAWFKQLEANGNMKDPGNPLEGSGVVVSGKKKLVKDGPFVESKDIVGGYLVIRARGIVEAVELSKSCPIFDGGGSVEVRPVQKLKY